MMSKVTKYTFSSHDINNIYMSLIKVYFIIKYEQEKIFLDVTNDRCPITFVKTKIALEKLKSHQYLNLYIKKGESLDGLPESLKELGFIINNRVKISDDVFSLEITR